MDNKRKTDLLVGFCFGGRGQILFSGYRTVHRTVLPNLLLVSLAKFGGRFESTLTEILVIFAVGEVIMKHLLRKYEAAALPP
jgi:hypothetical protein